MSTIRAEALFTPSLEMSRKNLPHLRRESRGEQIWYVNQALANKLTLKMLKRKKR